MTNRFLSETNTAAAIARATTTPICTGSTPIIGHYQIRYEQPDDNPQDHLDRAPSALRERQTQRDYAAIGAKKGCSLSSTSVARKYATLAATDV